MPYFLAYNFKYHDENDSNEGHHIKVGENSLMQTGLHIVEA